MDLLPARLLIIEGGPSPPHSQCFLSGNDRRKCGCRAGFIPPLPLKHLKTRRDESRPTEIDFHVKNRVPRALQIAARRTQLSAARLSAARFWRYVSLLWCRFPVCYWCRRRKPSQEEAPVAPDAARSQSTDSLRTLRSPSVRRLSAAEGGRNSEEGVRQGLRGPDAGIGVRLRSGQSDRERQKRMRSGAATR